MAFLPTTVKEARQRGWDSVDVVLFTGDVYIDHPAFGAAVIGRLLEAEGYRVAVVPQPNWRDDLRDFRKFGTPRLFFAVTAGAMDSMVNHYTANKRLRSNDAYTPGGAAGFRPDYAVETYTRILKQLYPRTPVVVGGIEASLRRLTHYDYWQDALKPSILVDSGADLLIYGMGERVVQQVAAAMRNGYNAKLLRKLRQVAFLADRTYVDRLEDRLLLHSYEECTADPHAFAENFRRIETESNLMEPHSVLVEPTGDRYVVVNPANATLSTEELDRSFDLPYERAPHPRYRGKGDIPAWEMIKHSVNIHRGCFGGCAFCTISAHQGKFISCRSKENILREVRKVIQMPGFKGYLSDLGGPSANMYGMHGRNLKACEHCKRPSCIHPQICPNLNTSHQKLLDIYHAVDALPGIKKSFIGSGVRYDLLLHRGKDEEANRSTEEYTRELITRHVSGRLKVAPEHTCPHVLYLMRKPSFDLFYRFKAIFDRINREEGLNQQIIPYFISSHPGCHAEDMAELAAITKDLDFHLEQVQDFTPTPMTVSTEAWYTGYDPYTLEPVFSAKTPSEKLAQRMFFFWYQRDQRPAIERELRRLGRTDILDRLYGGAPKQGSQRGDREPRGGHNRRGAQAREDYSRRGGQPREDYNRRGDRRSASHGEKTSSYKERTASYKEKFASYREQSASYGEKSASNREKSNSYGEKSYRDQRPGSSRRGDQRREDYERRSGRDNYRQSDRDNYRPKSKNRRR